MNRLVLSCLALGLGLLNSTPAHAQFCDQDVYEWWDGPIIADARVVTSAGGPVLFWKVDNVVHRARVDATGQPLDASILEGIGPYFAVAPRGGGFVVVYREANADHGALRGASLDAAGQLSGGTFSIDDRDVRSFEVYADGTVTWTVGRTELNEDVELLYARISETGVVTPGPQRIRSDSAITVTGIAGVFSGGGRTRIVLDGEVPEQRDNLTWIHLHVVTRELRSDGSLGPSVDLGELEGTVATSSDGELVIVGWDEATLGVATRRFDLESRPIGGPLPLDLPIKDGGIWSFTAVSDGYLVVEAPRNQYPATRLTAIRLDRTGARTGVSVELGAADALQVSSSTDGSAWLTIQQEVAAGSGRRLRQVAIAKLDPSNHLGPEVVADEHEATFHHEDCDSGCNAGGGGGAISMLIVAAALWIRRRANVLRVVTATRSINACWYR